MIAFSSNRIALCKYILMISAILTILPRGVRADTSQSKPYFQMSLEELMNTEVTIGTLEKTKMSDVPAAVTIITKDDIAISPARNIADLIETYVPGATFAAHQENRVGIRGIMSDRSYKILLLVNGRNLNNSTNQGAVLELQNWDMNDIERIEIIRGPGSVVYGPGAIAGIVNIITKEKADSPGTTIGADYDALYNSYGAHADCGFDLKGAQIYSYASYHSTAGVKRPDYFNINGTNGTYGFLGKDYLGTAVISPYYEDVLTPQFKAYLDIKFSDDWRLWARYTNSGMPDYLNGQAEALYGADLLPQRFELDKGFEIFLENKHTYNKILSLESCAGFTTQQELQVYNLTGAASARKYNEGITNYTPENGNVFFGLAENTLYLESLMHFDLDKINSASAGASFSEEWVTSPYFFNIKIGDREIAAGFQNNLAPDRTRLQDVAGDGFSAYMFSLLGEWDCKLHRLADIRLSGRIDKNQYSDFLYSPRAAIISEINDMNTLKLIWQKSVRMNTLLESYENDYASAKNNPETLDAFEAIFDITPNKNVIIEIPFFLYDLQAMGFNSAISRTTKLGELYFLGLEPEIKYQDDKIKAGISHSWLQQIHWGSGENITSEGISYADYGVKTGSLNLLSSGFSINNIPEQATKFYITVQKLFWNLTAHTDAQIFWNYQGKKDGLDMYQNAYDVLGGSARMDNIASVLDKYGFGGINIKLNVSLSKTFKRRDADYTITLYGMNLLGFKRYVYDGGSSQAYPQRMSWVDEPPSFGVKGQIKF